jgi:hypothetical protein
MARGIAHREWYIDRGVYESEQDFRAAVENEQALNVHIQERLGVAIVSAPVRTRNEFGRWHTEAYVFQTASVPAAREQEADDDEEDFQSEPLIDEPALVEDPA